MYQIEWFEIVDICLYFGDFMWFIYLMYFIGYLGVYYLKLFVGGIFFSGCLRGF